MKYNMVVLLHSAGLRFLNYADHCLIVVSIVVTYFVLEC